MTPEQRKLYETRKWEWAVQHLNRLIELQAPGCIKAHALINIILPRLIRMMNIVEESSVCISGLLMDGLGFKSGMCSCCKKVRLTIADKIDTCPKCTAEIDQLGAESPEERLMDAIFNSDPDKEDDEEDPSDMDNFPGNAQ